MNKVIDIKPDDEVVIVKDHKPVAKLVATSSVRTTRKAGNCKGMITLLVEDDEHLKDFAEYMY